MGSSQILTRDQLTIEQEYTLSQPRMRSGLGAKALFLAMDVLYGKEGSLPKFRVLEVVARVPYIAWEQVSYVAITHTHSSPTFARQIHEDVTAFREQQDNELFHLLIIEELLRRAGVRQGFWRFRLAPQVMAWIYYHLSWFLFVIHPKLSYKLNAQFEDHAEHEYMRFVADNPQLEDQAWVSDFKQDYGDYANVADLLRQIALDEREHKLESIDHAKNARFSQRRTSLPKPPSDETLKT